MAMFICYQTIYNVTQIVLINCSKTVNEKSDIKPIDADLIGSLKIQLLSIALILRTYEPNAGFTKGTFVQLMLSDNQHNEA